MTALRESTPPPLRAGLAPQVELRRANGLVPAEPTRAQVSATGAICSWYLSRYHNTPSDLGVPAMFMRPEIVGAFAITPEEFERGVSRALFRLLVATTVFQRRQDQQVLRILRGLSNQQVRELTSPRRLLQMADGCGCPLAQTQRTLLTECDLGKDTEGIGTCGAQPGVACHMKRHTVWLKRYGHFGKVPTSAAMMLRENGAGTLGALYRRVLRQHATPLARSEALEAQLSEVWRVSEKIAAMFLSMLCNPDLGGPPPPWTGVDWSYFVVIDSNTDLFLRSIRYEGPWTYSARRQFLWKLAARVDLSKSGKQVHANNPRLVQQAVYVFMSQVNRRASAIDCWRAGPSACRVCPNELRDRCPVRAQA